MDRLALVFLLLIPAFVHADPIPKPDRKPVKIEGSTWEGTDSMGNSCKFTFLKDGVLEYKTNNRTYRTGSWKVDGTKLTWECNNHYADFEGDIKKDEIKIDAHNITGLKWTITIKPAKDDPEKKEKK